LKKKTRQTLFPSSVESYTRLKGTETLSLQHWMQKRPGISNQ